MNIGYEISDEEKEENELQSYMFAMLFDMGYSDDKINYAIKRCNSISSALQLLDPNYNLNDINYLFRCPICFDECHINDMITLNCLHRICLNCFKNYCELKINENEVLSDELCCPVITTSSCFSSNNHNYNICGNPITVHEIKENVNCEVFQKYEQFITRAFCHNENLTCCPKCNDWYIDLQDVLHLEHTWKSIKCQKCNHQFCGKCGEIPHKAQYEQDLDCISYSKWLELNSKTDDKFKEFIKNNNIFSCPKCKMYGSLESGCKFMYCRCKQCFCALCGLKLNQSNHFNHFINVPGATGPFGNVCVGMKRRK